MRKFDACVGREARINKLLLKKPPGLMSARGASLDEPLRAMKEEKKWEGEKCRQKNTKRDGQRKETNTESGARHRIFGDGWRSTGSARVSYPTHLADGTPHQSGLGRL